jgi:regulator of protease activity HflC (stomatin/prohibitin superfamily)
MDIKFKILIGAAIVAVSSLLLVRIVRIEPGYVGIKINLVGAPRGPQDLPLKTGWQVYCPLLSQVFEYPVFMQTATWSHDNRNGDESITWNTSDQVSIGADINLSYTILREFVPMFYITFRSDKLDIFTHGYLRNVARDAFTALGTQYTFDDINGAKKDEFLQAVKTKINEDIAKYGIHIEQFGIIGRIHMPESIANAITEKTQAIQKAIQAENELRQAKAEAAKQVATAQGEAQSKIIRAESEAKANEIVSKSITQNLIMWEAIRKWNGVRPLAEGVNATMMLPLKNNKE